MIREMRCVRGVIERDRILYHFQSRLHPRERGLSGFYTSSIPPSTQVFSTDLYYRSALKTCVEVEEVPHAHAVIRLRAAIPDKE